MLPIYSSSIFRPILTIFRSRTIKANDFKINGNEISASIRKLNSALTNPKDLNLPRLRRESRLFEFPPSEDSNDEEDLIHTPNETPAPNETPRSTRKYTKRGGRPSKKSVQSEYEEESEPEQTSRRRSRNTVAKSGKKAVEKPITDPKPSKRGRKPKDSTETPKGTKRGRKPAAETETESNTPKKRKRKVADADVEADVLNYIKSKDIPNATERPKRDRNSPTTDNGEEVDKYIEDDVEAYSRERSYKEAEANGSLSIVQDDNESESASSEFSSSSDDESSESEDYSKPKAPMNKPKTLPKLPLPKPNPKRNLGTTATIDLDDLDKYSTSIYTSVHDRKQKGPKTVKPLLTLKSVLALPSGGRDRTFESIVPLSKRKFNEKQKPLMVEALRILVDSNNDRRLKINTLDVLRQLIINFDPKVHKNRFINEQVLHDEFKSHLIHSLSHVVDAHASIKDISDDIHNVQKQKNEFRKKIFDLKNNHAKVGDELNKLRAQYNESKANYETSSALIDLFSKVNKRVSNETDIELFTNDEDENDAIDKNLSSLSRIINPHSGVYKKLSLVNDKLSQVDYEL